MADKWVARGTVHHNDNVFYPGDAVTGLKDEELQELVEAGSVLKESDLERRDAPSGPSEAENELRKRNQELVEEVATLRAKLAAADAARGPQKPPTAAEQVKANEPTTNKNSK
jgi:hypothetical protein